jgi:chemotaxis protein CheY-P-specific phosphatase CheC
MEYKSRESFVLHAMNVGMVRAAKSFSILLNSPVRTSPPQILTLEHNDNFLRLKESDGDVYVLITQVIGDVNGRSYLMFNDEECNALLKLIRKEGVFNDTLKEAFLMEIDNIVSAAVITELSDLLKGEIYGDVPQIKKISGKALYDFIAADKEAIEHGNLVVNTGFNLEKNSKIHPQFIWKLSPSLLEMIPSNLIAVQPG